MLTDRQQKFYENLNFLLSLSSSASYEEREIISWTKKEIEQSKNFKDTMNVLLLKLDDLNEYRINGLSHDVKLFFNELVKLYGDSYKESRDKMNDTSLPSRTYGTSMNRYIWSKNNGRLTLSGMLNVVFSIAFFALALYVIFASPVLPYLNNKYGDIGDIVFLIALFILYSVFVYTRRKGKKNKK